jgi:EAL domain-containing protein (putative c-di-GMP-specific phosphodiesterase class I)
MGQGLKMKILAEGVETALQFNFLKNNNCDIIQGYLLSRPVPKEKIVEILKAEEEGKGIGIQLMKKIRENAEGSAK